MSIDDARMICFAMFCLEVLEGGGPIRKRMKREAVRLGLATNTDEFCYKAGLESAEGKARAFLKRMAELQRAAL